MSALPAIIAFLLLLLAASCTQDADELVEVPTVGTVISSETVTASFTGLVTDAADVGVAGVTVSAGAATATTDETGAFVIDDATVVGDAAQLTFRAEGFAPTSRTLVVAGGGTYAAEVELLDLSQSSPIDAGRGGTAAADNSAAEAAFPSAAFATDNGNAVSGEVSVAVHYIDPSAEGAVRQMPGDMRTREIDGTTGTLAPLSALSVDLRDERGVDVDLADGKTALLTLPVSEALLPQAGATAPLYYFDEAAAAWIPEGSATLQGDAYVGEVSHFTVWAIGASTSAIKICGALVTADADGNEVPASARRVIVTVDSFPLATAATNELGEFCAIVPAGADVTLSIRNVCGEFDAIASVEAADADVTLGAITVAPRGAEQAPSVTGVFSCAASGDAIIYNSLTLVINGEEIERTRPNAAGAFAFRSLECLDVADAPDSLTIVVDAVPAANLLRFEKSLTYAFATTLDIGTVELCADLPNVFGEDFTLTEIVNGTDTTFFDSGFIGIDGADFSLTASSDGNSSIGFNGEITGEGFPTTGSFFFGSGVYYPAGFDRTFRYNLEGQTIEVTEYAAKTDEVPGLLAGTILLENVTDANGDIVTVELTFRGAIF